jgi:2-dehydropantoate 2-reductase
MTAHVLVVGAGAIGGILAAKLSRAGADVTVLDANTEHVSAMRDPGLALDELGVESVVPMHAISDVTELERPADFALISLKAPFIEPALRPLVDAQAVDTYVSCGNGLVQGKVADVVGEERMMVGIVEWGATNLGPGRLRQTTQAPLVLGEVDGTMSDRLTRLAGVLSMAGETRTSANIMDQVWTKLLLNSTFSGLGAVTGGTYAEIMALPDGPDLAFAMWTEGYDVAVAAGRRPTEVAGVDAERLVVRSPADRASAVVALAELMARLGPTKASMLQDLERGARTEIDVINGGVVTTAEAIGVSAPLNAAVVDIVHRCEAGDLQPRAANIAVVR